MNPIVVLSFLFLQISSMFFGQTSKKPMLTNLLHYKELSKESINTVNKDILLYYLSDSSKAYKLVYTYAKFCKPCRAMHPKIIELQNKLTSNLDVYYVADIYNERDAGWTLEYVRSIGNTSPVLSITDDKKFETKPGKYKYFTTNASGKKEPIDRYTYFVQQLVPGHQKFGYGLCILYDKDNKVIYASTYEETDEQVIDKIKKLISS